jgi:flagellar biosynthesis GTPase FlhF
VVARREAPRYDAADATPPPAAAAPPEVLVAPPVAPGRPAAADAAERRLVDGGLSAGLAADIVGEAVTHGLPFAQPRAFKKLVRSALARRLPVMADLGPDRRVIAVAGAGGAGKTELIGRLAAAYAAADHEVVVVALGSRDGGCAVAAALEPLGVSVIAAGDAAQAARRLRHRAPLITLIDTPALGAGDARAAAALAPELRALGCTEVHLALPATVSAAAADEITAALAPLGLTHLALTHADQTARPGAPLELAIRTRRPLSYVGTRDEVAPADPLFLASGLLP